MKATIVSIAIAIGGVSAMANADWEKCYEARWAPHHKAAEELVRVRSQLAEARNALDYRKNQDDRVRAAYWRIPDPRTTSELHRDIKSLRERKAVLESELALVRRLAQKACGAP